MGWASGSQLAGEVWDIVRPYIQTEHKRTVAQELIKAFEDHDCDTLDECPKLIKAAGLEDRYFW